MRLVVVVMLMAAVALMEGMAVALLVPLMSVVMNDTTTQSGMLGSFVKITQEGLGLFHIGLTLSVVLVLIVFVFVLQGLFRLLMWHFQSRMLTMYESELVHNLFSGYFNSSWGFFVKSQVGHLMNTLTVETDRATGAFGACCNILSALLIMIFYGVLSLLVSWQITLIGIVLSIVVSMILNKFMERAHGYGIKTSIVNGELHSYSFDKLGAAKLVKSSATERTAVDNLDDIIKQKARLRYLSWMNTALVQSIYQPLIMAILALIIFFALTRLGISFAVILLFTYIFFRLTPYFSSIQLSYQQALLLIPAAEEIDRVIKSAQSMSEVRGGRKIAEFKRSIVFDNVSFGYEDKTLVLSNVNLEIKKGESVAILGESGMGKTTIIDLLLGLFSPDQGQILIDGVPLSELDLAEWRNLVGYVSQEVFLFNNTVEANLKWMVPDATSEQVEAAAKTAYAHEFIVNMPNGYRSIIGDRGVKLSGGQRQRLALARTILKNPQIILLDEATSALDSESENKIQQAIEKLSADRTVVIISHRSSLLKNVDRVFALDSGNVRELNSDEREVKRNNR